MTFNIWNGGDQVNLAMVAEAILKANPDLVAIQESEGNLQKLQKLLGWSHMNPRTQLLSKYPLFDPPINKMGKKVRGEGEFSQPYSYVEIIPGQIIAVANVHLTSDFDGSESLQSGSSIDEVIAQEKMIRLTQIEPIYQQLSELIEKGIPTFLLGDLNSPSHLDYPDIAWPVSHALTKARFRDSYREIHPNIVADPGLTWTAGYPSPRIKSNEIMNRIDYIWTQGNAITLDSFLVGEAGEHRFHNQYINKGVELSVTPWPSDHRAVVSDFLVKPSPAPIMLGINQRIVVSGEEIQLRFCGQNKTNLSMVVQSNNQNEVFFFALDETDRSMFTFNTTYMVPDSYKAMILDEKKEEQFSLFFEVISNSCLPKVHLSQNTYSSAEPICISWQNAPANKWDWIGIYQLNTNHFQDYISYFYTDASVEGSCILDPMAVGNYEIRFFCNDSFIVMTTNSFSVH